MSQEAISSFPSFLFSLHIVGNWTGDWEDAPSAQVFSQGQVKTLYWQIQASGTCWGHQEAWRFSVGRQAWGHRSYHRSKGLCFTCGINGVEHTNAQCKSLCTSWRICWKCCNTMMTKTNLPRVLLRGSEYDLMLLTPMSATPSSTWSYHESPWHDRQSACAYLTVSYYYYSVRSFMVIYRIRESKIRWHQLAIRN